MTPSRQSTPQNPDWSRFAGNKVLVTGGLGFIGSNLARVLVDAGARVTIVDSLVEHGGGNRDNVRDLQGQVVVDYSDLRRARQLPALVRVQDYIFHLAGQSGHSGSMRDPLGDLEINCAATVNLVEACRRWNPEVRLVFTSTRQVYGRTTAWPVNEDHPTQPVDVNGIHKLAAERYLHVYHHVYGLRTTVLRLTNTYGPRQKLGDAQLGITGLFIHQALTGQTLRLYDGHQYRDFNYVDDVTAALLLAARQEECCGGVYNLGVPQPTTLAYLAQLLQRLSGCEINVVPFPPSAKAIDIGDYHGDYSRFRKATGWEPRMALEEGLERTLAFYRVQRQYWSGVPTPEARHAESLIAERSPSGRTADE